MSVSWFLQGPHFVSQDKPNKEAGQQQNRRDKARVQAGGCLRRRKVGNFIELPLPSLCTTSGLLARGTCLVSICSTCGRPAESKN